MADVMTIRVIAEVQVATHAEEGFVRRELRELITNTLQAEVDRQGFGTGAIDQTLGFRVRTVRIGDDHDYAAPVIKPLS